MRERPDLYGGPLWDTPPAARVQRGGALPPRRGRLHCIWLAPSPNNGTAMSDDLPPAAEPTPTQPGSMYFEVTPYQPDGGAPFLGVLLTLGLLTPGAVVAGWLLSELIPLVWAI